jgi:hypothetical protein
MQTTVYREGGNFAGQFRPPANEVVYWPFVSQPVSSDKIDYRRQCRVNQASLGSKSRQKKGCFGMQTASNVHIVKGFHIES